MSDKQKKRYYWLKLKEDFFEEDTIEWLEEQPNGKEYCLLYLKLCLKSLKTDGLLVRNVGNMMIPYDPESLAKFTNSSADTVKVAMDLFNKIGLIQITEGGEIYLSQLDEMVGSETEAAKQKRIQRSRGGQCPPDVLTLSGNSRLEKELEKEKEIELEKEQEVEQVDDEVYPGELIQTLYGQFPSALLSKAIAEWVQEWDRSMINYAIEIAYEYSIEINKLKPYLNKIFENWKNAKFTTVEQAKEANKKFKEQHAKPKYQKTPAKQEVVPKWLADQQNEKQASKSVKQAEPVEAAVSEDVIEARLQAYLKQKEERGK